VGYDRNDDILRGFAAMGYPVTREHFAFRTDDLIASGRRCAPAWAWASRPTTRSAPTPPCNACCPCCRCPACPIWLTVHREIRTSGRIRAVYDFLAQAIPLAL
jgi:hypothetical protein